MGRWGWGELRELRLRWGRAKQLGSVLLLGELPELEQPLLFADKTLSCWLSNVSLVPFFGDKQTHPDLT